MYLFVGSLAKAPKHLLYPLIDIDVLAAYIYIFMNYYQNKAKKKEKDDLHNIREPIPEGW